MKSTSFLLAGLLGLAAATALTAQSVTFAVPGEQAKAPAAQPAANTTTAAQPAASASLPSAIAAPQADAAAQSKVTEEQILETFGWYMAAEGGIPDLRFTPEQVKSFVKGVALASGSQPPPYDLKTVGPVMQAYIVKRQELIQNMELKQNTEAADKLFAELKKDAAVKSLPDGLYYKILQAGTGPNATMKDSVKIEYTGRLINGQVFDSTKAHGEPLTIALDHAIPGWAEGMQQINKGGKIELYIPAKLAYGEKGFGGIPAGATVIFSIDVLDIFPTPPPAKDAATPAAAPAAN